MAKNTILYLLILFLYSCGYHKCNNNVREDKIPLIITKTDTVYVQMQITPSLQRRYTNALRKYIGTKEETGKNDGATVEMILKNCGFDIPQPWCACYLNQGLLDINLQGPVNQPAYTPNWFKDPERITWTRDKNPINVSFQEGWIGGIYFRTLKRVGHVACVLEDFGDNYVLTIEGNTNAQGGREGNGVYLRIRHKSEFYVMSDWLTKQI